MTRQKKREAAEHRLSLADDFPYDGRKRSLKIRSDWAHRAARGILSDLTDRRGIKWELEACDADVRRDIVDSIAEIVRAAHDARGK